jgi:HEPN domain-containing protein
MKPLDFMLSKAAKFIKAVLGVHGIVFERTHDLAVLHGFLERHQTDMPTDKEKLRALNAYAVQFRYQVCAVEMIPSVECENIAAELAHRAMSITGSSSLVP